MESSTPLALKKVRALKQAEFDKNYNTAASPPSINPSMNILKPAGPPTFE